MQQLDNAAGRVSRGHENLDLRLKSRSRREACGRRDTRSVGSKKKSPSGVLLQDECREKKQRGMSRGLNKFLDIPSSNDLVTLYLIEC